MYIYIIYSIFFFRMYFAGWWISGSILPSSIEKHSGSFGWKARIVSALSVPIGREVATGCDDYLTGIVFFCPRIENDPSKHALFVFLYYIQHAGYSIQWLFVEFNLFWSHLGAISCMTLRHRVSYLSLTLQGVQDKYSNLQKHDVSLFHVGNHVSRNPTWISLTYAIYLCLECSGEHRRKALWGRRKIKINPWQFFLPHVGKHRTEGFGVFFWGM